MKIHPDQIEGVQPEQLQRKNKTNTSGQAFGDLLNQEVAKGESPQSAAGVAPPQIVNPLIATEAVNSVSTDTDDTVEGQVESVLDKWDDYATTLAGPEAGLKSAYGTLDQIASEVAAIKEGDADLDPGLKSIVDELETLTATEQFKFNRGDYS
ncbi:flagellar assembly protein FliX [Pseudodesulfovibrio piezophilus]|uniref:Uncharacterized protein n=1 Tax=Pseudodesulfovibrio piezophilus (strain DSM 21447 / JCM 15486 / C1TLV30) TaxID=1322246 RepID=M1WSQ4_PSEP2|nr:flagellar assembly protein FliX [Pseudodesulfovibrio piezophilus]CCH49032.1 conserved protein of unknown function [Pseudodesulfovibrio piezophilus C1TLV30]